MRPIKNKVLRNALWLAIQYDESILDAYANCEDDYKEFLMTIRKEINQFKKLLDGGHR